MKPSSRLGALLVLIPSLVNACECIDRRDHDAASTGNTTDAGATALESATGVMEDTLVATTTVAPVDVSPFIGIFHNEHWVTPFGREVHNAGGDTLANLEIRADGTASMTMETCNLDKGTRYFEWTWEAQPGPRLEFSPGPGEESLRFLALTELESLSAFLIEPCAFQFEADGVPIPAETFRPGKACWVNRCEPSYKMHIDYCEGEEPPPCE